MLRFLTIKNFAVISELHLEFDHGLNVFTGQTGAGKSILIEALGFLLGARGSLEWLRTGADKLEVGGVFDSKDISGDIRSKFKISGPAFSIRRELDGSGKTRTFIQDQSATASILAEAGEGLVDFHGQHEHQSLLKPSVQMEMLDGFGGLQSLRVRVLEAYRRWSALEKERQGLQLSDDERLRRLDLYGFQLREIEESNPKPGEEEEIEAALPRLKNAERIRALSSQAHQALYDQEDSTQETLLKAQRALEELIRLDAGLEPEMQSLTQARTLIQDVASRLSSYRDQAGASPAQLDDMLSRLDRLAKLRKKYGPALQDVLVYRDRIKGELALLEDSSARTQDIEAALSQAVKELDRLCAELHKARLTAATKLASKVSAELKGLGMLQARFSASVETEEGRRGPTGADEVEFLIAPNPGEPLKPIKSIASGGELSRVMLALKTVHAKMDKVPVLVFDEVDTGVGGEVGLAVGRRLFELGKTHQVLCVTHLPQVASYAGRHFEVVKDVSAGRTFTRVDRLDADKRLEILARMLGGREATATSRRHAQELLEACR